MVVAYPFINTFYCPGRFLFPNITCPKIPFTLEESRANKPKSISFNFCLNPASPFFNRSTSESAYLFPVILANPVIGFIIKKIILN